MPSRIPSVTRETTDDPDLKQLLNDGAEGWWKDSEMFGVIGTRQGTDPASWQIQTKFIKDVNDAGGRMYGVIARVPDLLKTIVPVFGAFFGGGRIAPHVFEMMRIKTGPRAVLPRSRLAEGVDRRLVKAHHGAEGAGDQMQLVLDDQVRRRGAGRR